MVPATALVVVCVVPLFVLTMLVVAVIVILLVILRVVACGLPSLVRNTLVVVLLSRGLLIFVVLLLALPRLLVGHWCGCAMSARNSANAIHKARYGQDARRPPGACCGCPAAIVATCEERVGGDELRKVTAYGETLQTSSG